MKVRALYFASVRDACGLAEEHWELVTDATIGTFAALLVERYPILRERASALRFARNEVFAELGESVQEADTLAVIPPVSGG
jgi:molybdopterin converting factor subunit 1